MPRNNALVAGVLRHWTGLVRATAILTVAVVMPGVAQASGEQPSVTAGAPSAATAANVSQDLDQALDTQSASAPTGSTPSISASGQIAITTDDGAIVAPDALGALPPTTDDGFAVGSSTEADTSDLTLSLPVQGPEALTGASAIYLGTHSDNEIVVQSIAGGTRAAVHIDSADAPERYTFHVGGDAATLSINGDGSITIRDAADQSIGQIAAPWARDADGVAVPTHYDVSDLTLTQVVEHRDGGYAYGITADPAVITWTHAGWRFGHTNSERVFHYLAVGVIAGISGVVCAAVTENPAIGYGCATMVGAIASDIGKSLARSALAGHKCLEIGAYFFPPHPYAKITGC